MDDVFTFTYLAVTPGFSTPAEYNDFRNSLFVFMLLLFFIRIITVLMLIKNGQKCMNMEVNGEDPYKTIHMVSVSYEYFSMNMPHHTTPLTHSRNLNNR